jgi:hypothetical protein
MARIEKDYPYEVTCIASFPRYGEPTYYSAYFKSLYDARTFYENDPSACVLIMRTTLKEKEPQK